MKFNLYSLDNEFKINLVKTIDVQNETDAYYYVMSGQVDYYEEVK